jgi:hypothetical protein
MPSASFGNMPYAERHFVGYAICQQHIYAFLAWLAGFLGLYHIIFNNFVSSGRISCQTQRPARGQKLGRGFKPARY